MRKFLILLLLACSARGAAAQIPDVLLEACNNIQNSEKRLACLKAAANEKSKTTQPNNLAQLKKAFGDIRASLDLGVSYNNYQTALLELAKAIATFKREATQKEKTGLEYFEESLNSYNDAGILWAKSIEFYARRDNLLSYGGGLPISVPKINELVSKYNLQTVKADLLGFQRGVSVNTSRSLIWAKAHEQAEEGFKIIENPAHLTFNEALNICGKYMNALNDYKEKAAEDREASTDTILAVKYGKTLSCMVGKSNKKVIKVTTHIEENTELAQQNNMAPPPDPKAYSKFVAGAKAILESSVDNPSAVKYQSLYISGATHHILCGEVNITNRSGEYVGFRRFYANAKTIAEIENPQDNAVFLQMWPAVCQPKLVDVE
ncbi:MAG: hypothetical protein K1X48_08505 [Burkholderiaceae bacterium]|nr:hypothetical protein [Burkholderiaceae bacterium]